MPRISKKLLEAANEMLASNDQGALVEGRSTADLLEWHNANAERFGSKPVAKFKNRAAAEERVLALAQAIVDAANAPPAQKPPRGEGAQSGAVAASWADPQVAAARAQRHAVVVAGERYKSVRKAFEALGLDLKQHGKVRAQLVKDGKVTFAEHKFALAPAEA